MKACKQTFHLLHNTGMYHAAKSFYVPTVMKIWFGHVICQNVGNALPVLEGNSLKFIIFMSSDVNPIRSGLFQTTNDPGGGGFKSPPPYDLENYFVNLHHIIHVPFTRCFRHVPIGIFQKFAILIILQRFQNIK